MDTLPQMIRQIPEPYRSPRFSIAFVYFCRDVLGIFLLGYGIVAIDSWVWGPALSLCLGAVIGGLFILGHDCGHRSFARKVWVNDLFGHLTTSWVMWPFHVWRLDHDHHHRFTGHVDRDTAWRPITYRLWKRMPRTSQRIYLWTRQLFFLGSFYTTYSNIKQAVLVVTRAEPHPHKRLYWSSLIITALAVGLYAGVSIWLAGLYGFVCLFVIPQLVFHFLLSTFTYFHHTAPDAMFHSKSTWKPGALQMELTLHIQYPRLLENFVHHINWHVPHHICVLIPHYRLKKCHALLKAAYPEEVQERRFSWRYAWEVSRRCHFISSKIAGQMRWLTHSEAAAGHLRRTHDDAAAPALIEPGTVR